MAYIEIFIGVLQRCSPLTLLALAFLAYIAGLVVYRLYLSPIAKFPGPKFTAVTGLCQFYHDVIRGGQFTFVIQQWHEKYGLAPSLDHGLSISSNSIQFRTNHSHQPIRDSYLWPRILWHGLFQCSSQQGRIFQIPPGQSRINALHPREGSAPQTQILTDIIFLEASSP